MGLMLSSVNVPTRFSRLNPCNEPLVINWFIHMLLTTATWSWHLTIFKPLGHF